MEKKGRHGKRKSSQHKHKVDPKNKNSKNSCKDLSSFKYYGTDEEEYTYHSFHTYSMTSFPLFSISDDEITKSVPERTAETEVYSPCEIAPTPPAIKEKKSQSQCGIHLQSNRQETSRKKLPVNDDLQYFPFNQLPNELKFKIFSYLSNVEKGTFQRTCRLWRKLLQTPSLWTNVSLSDFPVFCTRSCEIESIHFNCYPNYKHRVKNFFDFLMKIKPSFRKLDIKLDIGDPYDNYLALLQDLVEHGNLSELRILNLNWKETPAKPFRNISSMSSSDIVFSHRYRSKLFTGLFDNWTNKCPKLTTLVLKFDWLGRSIESITRLVNLETLVIEKYFVFQPMEQSMLDKILCCLPKLKRLLLEVWSPSGPGFTAFSMTSNSLEFLDISQSRGFYLHQLDMPNLTSFHMSRQPYSPLVCAEHIQLPCIYDVLVRGAPELKKINEHYLERDWKQAVYQKLLEVLKSVCSCRKHKFGWTI